jgi:hypothetical protein
VKPLLYSLVLIAGCTAPSFYDDNESLLSVQVRYEIDRMDCNNLEMTPVKNAVDMLALYSESKGSTDVTKMVLLMQDTVNSTTASAGCPIKKKLLEKQSADIARALMWRY